MDVVIKNLFLEQIRLELQLVDGEVKKSKVQAIMKHYVRSISAAINRSASRNILLKATKMVNLARHTPYPTKLLLFLFLRPHLLFFLNLLGGPRLLQEFELQIMNQDVVQIIPL